MFKHKMVKVGVISVVIMALVLANALIASANPLTITLTLNPVGTVNRIGQVTLTGTISCSRPTSYSNLNGQMTQLIARALLSGSFYAYPVCGPTPTPWSATFRADNGIFSGGQAKVTYLSAYACVFVDYYYDCGYTSLPSTLVRLKGSPQ
jgi:hypothetical protein